jgi:hypothetical protein
VPARAIIERDTKDYFGAFVTDMMLAMASAAEDVRTFLTTMPPKKPKWLAGPLPGGFYSEKQKRFVFWAMHVGEIVVPYMRTADLARSWTVEHVKAVADALAVEIYQDPSLAPYGRHVQDPKVRPPMHEDWPTPELAKEKLEPKIMERLKEVGEKYGFR